MQQNNDEEPPDINDIQIDENDYVPNIEEQKEPMNIIVEEQKIEPQIIADDDDPPALQADQDNIVVEVEPDDMNVDELDDEEIDRLMLDAHDNSSDDQDNNEQMRVETAQVFVVRSGGNDVSRNLFRRAKQVGRPVRFDWINLSNLVTNIQESKH